ncbi:hypothetical protein EV182_001900, partial [Spiromyces aspiralis]
QAVHHHQAGGGAPCASDRIGSGISVRPDRELRLPRRWVDVDMISWRCSSTKGRIRMLEDKLREMRKKRD